MSHTRPDDPPPGDGLYSVDVDGEDLVIYDPENGKAWVQGPGVSLREAPRDG